MLKTNILKCVLLLSISLVFTNIKAQFSPPVIQNQNIGPETSAADYQQAITSLHPIYISEIVTHSNEVFRGKVYVEEDGYSIITRNKKVYSFRSEEVKEVAWTIPDKRDLKYYNGFGLYGASLKNNAFIPSIGFIYDFNWELPKHDLVISLPIQFGVDYQPRVNEDVLDYFSFELMLGKRFNRLDKVIHTVSAGGGIGSHMLYDFFEDNDNASPFVVGGQYDVEFSIGKKSSIAFFTKYQYYNRHVINHRLVFGITFRFYSIGISELLMMNSTPFMF